MTGNKTSSAVDKPQPTEPFKPERKSDVSFSGSPEEGLRVEVAREDSLKVIFGTEYPEISEGLMGHCLRVLKNEEANDDYPWMDQRAFMISAVAEMKPRDTFERMLSVQMAATHVAMIRSGRWLASAETLDQVKAHYSGYTKLARAYVTQMEALRKHRNGGKQTVTVQHVNVEGGGQAIVGNVETGGRVPDGK